jgi:hypothetical protein
MDTLYRVEKDHASPEASFRVPASMDYKTAGEARAAARTLASAEPGVTFYVVKVTVTATVRGDAMYPAELINPHHHGEPDGLAGVEEEE